MQRYFPIVNWIQGYSKKTFLKDLAGGLTVGVVAVPQGMAYAMIAGLPPVHGLYAAMVPLLAYIFLGTSKHLAIGPVAMDSLLVAAGLATLSVTGVENYIALAILLAFMVGSIQLLLGLFRMGFLANFMSKPVISAFTTAAALIIMFSQMKYLLGVNMQGSSYFYDIVAQVARQLPHLHWPDFAIGLLGIMGMVVLRKVGQRTLSVLAVVILGIAAAYFLHLDRYAVAMVGQIPKGLPTFALPSWEWQYVEKLAPMAIALAFFGYLEVISIGKGLEEKDGVETIRPDQELLALGASNILGSFFRGMPISASFARSAINRELGSQTPLSLLFSGAMVALTLLFLTPLFQYLPNAILAAIIMVSVFSLMDFGYARELWNRRRDEFLVWVATFAITLFLGIVEGILIGMLVALLLMVYRTSKPHFAVLGKIKGTEYYKNVDRFGDGVEVRRDVLIVRFDAQLYFANTAYFKQMLYKSIEAKGTDLRAVVLNAEAINYIDATGVSMLEKLIAELHQKGLQFYIVGANGPTRDILYSSALVDALGEQCLCARIQDAVAYFDHPSHIAEVWHKVAHQNQGRR